MNHRFVRMMESAVTQVHRTARWDVWRGLVPLPSFVYVLVTNACNEHCPFCFQRHRPEGSPAVHLSPTLFEQIVAQLPLRSFVSLSGGEPLCHPQIWSLLTTAVSRRLSLVTNGTLLTDETLTRLLTLAPPRPGGKGLNVLGISLFESVPGSTAFEDIFARKIATLERLRHWKDHAGRETPLVDVKVVARPETAPFLSRFTELLRNRLADFLTVQFENNLFYPLYYDGLLPEAAQAASLAAPRAVPMDEATVGLLAEQVALLHASPEHRAGRVRYYPFLTPAEVRRYFSGQPLQDNYYCVMPWCGIMIGPAGRAAVCRNERLESLADRSLREIWNSDNYRSFRRDIVGRDVGRYCAGCCFLQRR